MNKTVAYCVLLSAIAVMAALVISQPDVISDSNAFLRTFVGSDLLNILGVIVTITLASAGQLHLTFNEIEQRAGDRFLSVPRQSLKGSAKMLIILFGLAVLLVVLKPVVCETLRSQATANAMALLIILCNILILADLTKTAFAVQPMIDDDEP